MRPLALVVALLLSLAFHPPLEAARRLAMPEIADLRTESSGFVRLHWAAEPGAHYHLCHAADWAMTEFHFCDAIGPVSSWAVLPPAVDGAAWYLTLQACTVAGCSDAVRAGAVGRLARDGYDVTATALALPDGRVRLGATAHDQTLNLRLYRGAWGTAELYESACPDAEAGAPCLSADLALRGALAGIAAWRPGAAEAGLTLQVGPPPRIAFMFDDGAGIVTGGRYLMQTVLDEFGVKGSFFLTGRAMQTYPGAVRALVAGGHRVGNHTYTHPFLTRFNDAQIAAELEQTEAIYRALIPGSSLKPCFRAPNGDFNARVLAVLQAHGYRQYTQTISSMDYAGVSAATMYRTVVAEARDGASVSFHTQEPPTATALRLLIPRLQAEGFVFVTVC